MQTFQDTPADRKIAVMAVRTLLGILEAPISPGFLIIVTAWYRREEQVMRTMAFL
jgi:hypothetical protein